MRKMVGLSFALSFFMQQQLTAQTCNQPYPPGCLCIYFCTFVLDNNTNDCNVTLTWTTQVEPDASSSFKIWRSHDGANFMLVNTVPGNPGSSVPRTYNYTDVNPYNPNPSTGNVYYYIQLMQDGIVRNTTSIRYTQTTCTGSCGTGPGIMNGFSTPLAAGATMQLSLSGYAPQPIIWTSSNTNAATVSSSGLVTGVACGTTTITGRYVVCNVSVIKTLTVTPTAYILCPTPCSGIYTTTNMTGNTGDVVVLRLTYSGYINWTGSGGGCGATISLSAGGQSNTQNTPHYMGSSGFSLTSQITFTMPSSSVNILTAAVVHNVTNMLSSTATLTVVSVNGVPKNNQAAVCGGNSQGTW